MPSGQSPQVKISQNAAAQVKLPGTTWKQRKPHYEGIEELLMPGFLSHYIRVGESVVSLRSPSPGDFVLLRHRVADGTEEDWVAWSLATCTWMVDGIVTLGELNFAPRLAKVYRGIPNTCRSALFSVFLSLVGKMDKIARGLHAFCYEDRSRSLWHQFRGNCLMDESLTGIPGTQHLGMNLVQRMWLAYNRAEDNRLRQIAEWQNAKFIASAHAPKGVRQISQREQAQIQREEGRRQEEMDRYYYYQIGAIKEDNTLTDGRRLSRSTKTAEELQEEFQRWVAGDLDHHDQVVEEYKSKIMARFEEERHHREESFDALRAIVAEEESDTDYIPLAGDKLIALDLNQVSEMIRNRQGRSSPGARKVYDNAAAKREYLYNEHLKKKVAPPPPGGFSMTKDGKPSLPTGPISLNDQISQRRFTYNAPPTED